LLAGAGLFIETFRHLQSDKLGVAPDRVLTMGLYGLDETHYPTKREISAFYRHIFERLRGVPGVESATPPTPLPLRVTSAIGPPPLSRRGALGHRRPVGNPGPPS